jgi:hypothetical protein
MKDYVSLMARYALRAGVTDLAVLLPEVPM